MGTLGEILNEGFCHSTLKVEGMYEQVVFATLFDDTATPRCDVWSHAVSLDRVRGLEVQSLTFLSGPRAVAGTCSGSAETI